MTKDILINISGLQMDVDPNDPIGMMTTGAYYLRNGKHYILYDELSEDNEIVKNVIKIGPKSVELTRKGGQSSHMVFEEGKENLSYYDTPFGSLLMGVNTSNIDWIEEEEQMHLKVDRYQLNGKNVIKNDEPFMMVSIIEGTGIFEGNEVKKGDHFVICSDQKEVTFDGDMEVMISTL